jgi:DNA-binding transcriptional LysR family regulator
LLDPRFLQAQVYVAVIAEEKSFSRAARKLKLTQGFLSKRLGEIEKHLQVRIFDRSTHSVELTETGGVLLMEVHESLRHAERAYDLGRFWGRMIRGPIRIGYSPFSNGALMQSLFRLDLSKYEARRVTEEAVHEPPIKMESATTPVLVEIVLRGELHAALGVQPVDDKDLWCEVISREPYCVCIPKGHRLDLRAPTVPLRDLQGETIPSPPRYIHPDLHGRGNGFRLSRSYRF